MIKPKHLNKGDKIATISLSKGLAGTLQYRYDIGKNQIQEKLGLDVVEMNHTLKNSEWLYKNPKARAEDLMKAFKDKSIKAIFSTIGGEDSIRILPYIDYSIIRENPKIFIGYSDTTVSHLICYKAGLTSFYGPSVMANFAENAGVFPYTIEYFKKAVFYDQPIGRIQPSSYWTNEFLDWFNPNNQKTKRKLNKPFGQKILQGKGVVKGHLIGGCVQVLSSLIGTEIFPSLEKWKGAILFMEISESEMPHNYFRYFLRTLATIGVLENIVGIVFARAGGNRSNKEILDYDNILSEIIINELEYKDIAIIAQMDFGHTDPIFTIPYGVQAIINCEKTEFSIVESGVK